MSRGIRSLGESRGVTRRLPPKSAGFWDPVTHGSPNEKLAVLEGHLRLLRCELLRIHRLIATIDHHRLIRYPQRLVEVLYATLVMRPRIVPRAWTSRPSSQSVQRIHTGRLISGSRQTPDIASMCRPTVRREPLGMTAHDALEAMVTDASRVLARTYRGLGHFGRTGRS